MATISVDGRQRGANLGPDATGSGPKARTKARAMDWLALRMLTGDRAKYAALIFAISFSSFLITQQASIFWGLMNRTRSQILDVTDADIWVMDPATQYVDEVYSLKDTDLERVRGVPGVRWAVPFFKGQARAKAPDGKFRLGILLGMDDASLAGAPEPRRMILESIGSLRDPDAVLIAEAGYHFFFPGEPLMIMGGGAHLNIRADIDESDAWRVRPNTAAIAYPRGDTKRRIPLEFVRFEPYVVPKKSLTGDSTERVDTRVLQAIYRITDAKAPVHVGQQVDVYIDAPLPPGSARGAAGSRATSSLQSAHRPAGGLSSGESR